MIWRLSSYCWSVVRKLQSRTILEETYSRKYFSLLCYLIFFSISYVSTNVILHNCRYCEAFPAIKGAIQRLEKEKKRVQHKNGDKKRSKASSKSGLVSKLKSNVHVSTGTSFTLQRRLSTATPVRYDMYVDFRLRRIEICRSSLRDT